MMIRYFSKLIEVLQRSVFHRQEPLLNEEMTFEEWKLLYDSLKSDTKLITDFSDRREDWYDDDGR